MKVRIKKIPQYPIGGEGMINPFQTQETINKIDDEAPEHESGGVQVGDSELESGEVYTTDQSGEMVRTLEDTSDKRKDELSKALKLSADEVEQITGFKPKRGMTHSKAFEKSSEYWDKKLKSVENKLKKNMEYATASDSKYAYNALEENLKMLDSIPTKMDIFNALFDYQEAIKAPLQAQQGNKYAPGGKRSPYKNKPEGYGDLTKQDNYIKAYNAFHNTNFKTIGEVQKHRTSTYPELVKDYYTNQGTPPTNKHVTLTGQPEIDMEALDLTTLLEGDKDNLWGVRQILPQRKQFQTEQDWQEYVNGRNLVKSNNEPYVYDGNNLYTTPDFLPPTGDSQPQPQAQQQIAQKGNIPFSKKSKFNEPLRWYDVAGAVENLVNSDRIPVNYDSPNITYQSPKYIDPRPQLQNATASYNTAIQQLPSNGIGYANTANVFAAKYNIDNQVLGNTENLNNQIYNNHLRYEDQMKNQKSNVDYQARQLFEQKYLTSLEKKRQQEAVSRGDIYQTLALNRKLNREGNLVMSMFNYYDQEGNFNGNPYTFNANTPTNNILTDSKGGKYYVDKSTGSITKLKK